MWKRICDIRLIQSCIWACSGMLTLQNLERSWPVDCQTIKLSFCASARTRGVIMKTRLRLLYLPSPPLTSYSLLTFPRRWFCPRPEVIKRFSCSIQLSMKFFLLIIVIMLTIVGISIFISREIVAVYANMSLKISNFLIFLHLWAFQSSYSAEFSINLLYNLGTCFTIKVIVRRLSISFCF